MIESAPVKLTHNEIIKAANPTLGGSIAQVLADPAQDKFAEDDQQFLKFHGIYQQDDRDKRKTGKYYMFMVRGRMPGGVVTAEQYLAFDRLATDYANQTLRITSRQGFQFHGIVKSGLGKLMRGINEALLTTLAACGDVNRNVMAPSTPATSRLVERVLEDARLLSTALLPQTKAYHQIWVEGKELDLSEPETKDFVDPLYGKTYLPRKFKTAFAIPPLNDIDVFTNCLGFVAIAEGDNLVGYNLLAGGGLGMSHGNKETFPRMADVIGFFEPQHIEAVAKGVLTIHRDWGDRTNRKHARLKYVLEDRGAEWFREELERRVGIKFQPAREAVFTKQGDLFGWHKQFDGRNFLGLYVETGRIKDVPNARLKSALKAIVEQFRTEVRLTPSQNVILANIADEHISAITKILAEHGIPVENQATIIRRASMACPALPTCGLALAESERYLPDLLTRVEGLLSEVGLKEEEIIIRMTGCPNGCARPYMAEIGFVGKAPNKYQIYLGGNESATRLNRLFRENVKGEEILNELRPVLSRFATERIGKERFGDWCERVYLPELQAAQAALAAAPVSQN
ncbi:MAG: NADPH-dependent assimilatory sulfite reductase hemoprotein subunit [Verrucomicrobiota bacterium]|nr:NADPH-dependent assimilatory sulfite reductase hemoprotein subunit [Verrucomicrobiota bacterium]